MFQQGSASIYYYTVDADALYDYGDGSGPVHFSEFHCTGNETHLLNCSVDEDIAISVYCVNAGVRCPTGMLESEPHSSYHKSKKNYCLQSPVLKVKSDSTMKWFKYVIINNGLLCVHKMVAFMIVLQK